MPALFIKLSYYTFQWIHFPFRVFNDACFCLLPASVRESV